MQIPCRFLRGVLVSALLVSAGGAAAAEPYQLSDAERALVEASIKRGMRDPAAAQFQRVAAAKDGANGFVCGMVNGKNGFGGYVGFLPFYGRLLEGGEFKLAAIAKDRQTSHQIAMACANKGLRAFD